MKDGTDAQPLPTPGSLDDIWESVWDGLEQAVASHRHPWRLAALATPQPDVRNVVLRHADRWAGTLCFHTDLRSPKATFVPGPLAALFYDPSEKVQVRVQGQAEWADEAARRARWTSSRLSSRKCYLAPVAPGTPSDKPTVNLPSDLSGRDPTDEEAEHGYPYFGAIVLKVATLDWLKLAYSGHIRARFTPEGATWVAP
ncbi:MAG: hypothetical protein KF884_11910 [Fimbriimonadaceae bacterium]|nr:hypothetical protein [Fimbriimonadaceae bacterium]QYK58248.1 MAG: hypothetical protein KF884_11910 [Fimbriimonadaceae bacterium]